MPTACWRSCFNLAAVLPGPWCPVSQLSCETTFSIQILTPEDARRAVRASCLVSDVGADADASIMVATPPVALQRWRGPHSVRWVVLDEADLLLAGSFKRSARSNYPIELLIADVVKEVCSELSLQDPVAKAFSRTMVSRR